MNSHATLLEAYQRIRSLTLQLCATLEPEDAVVQSMADVSPAKWHLAHVTWFFERFVLEHFDGSYRRLNEDYDFLFNSYYYSVGPMHARPQRGLLTRPTYTEVLDYRKHIDDAMLALLQSQASDEELRQRVVLGLNHEQQHQELLLTDIKHVFFCNPMRPAVNESLVVPETVSVGDYSYKDGADGIHKAGADGNGFCFDNETPRHDALLHPHRIGTRLVTNGEYREFIELGGYKNSNLWLADGWATVNEHGWSRPMYWSGDLQSEFTLAGEREVDPNAPVAHLSFYEADAYARWAGARLPTEFEWELAAAAEDVEGNFVDANIWHPVASNSSAQFFGDVWEWTASSYAPYPGFKPLAGTLGEYNGKFMCNQMTVRGGSCVTSKDHVRASYRSFFYPHQRWQFLGFRLAQDA